MDDIPHDSHAAIQRTCTCRRQMILLLGLGAQYKTKGIVLLTKALVMRTVICVAYVHFPLLLIVAVFQPPEGK